VLLNDYIWNEFAAAGDFLFYDTGFYCMPGPYLGAAPEASKNV
jgi:hypothetical protein